MKPLITALVDTYNQGRYIEQALPSVLEQGLSRTEQSAPPSGVIAASRLLAVCLKSAVRKRLFGDP
jgi:hypothetical protein